MAGFAVNIKLLHKYPNATIIYKAGYEEDNFLKDLVADYNEIEPKAQNCTQVIQLLQHIFLLKAKNRNWATFLFPKGFGVAYENGANPTAQDKTTQREARALVIFH